MKAHLQHLLRRQSRLEFLLGGHHALPAHAAPQNALLVASTVAALRVVLVDRRLPPLALFEGLVLSRLEVGKPVHHLQHTDAVGEFFHGFYEVLGVLAREGCALDVVQVDEDTDRHGHGFLCVDISRASGQPAVAGPLRSRDAARTPTRQTSACRCKRPPSPCDVHSFIY